MKSPHTALILLALLTPPVCFAEAATDAAAAPPAEAAPAPAVNAHRTQEQRLHSCRLQAKRQRLAGEGRSIFIARCVKNATSVDAPAAGPGKP
jgi:hypothetical protein